MNVYPLRMEMHITFSSLLSYLVQVTDNESMLKTADSYYLHPTYRTCGDNSKEVQEMIQTQ